MAKKQNKGKGEPKPTNEKNPDESGEELPLPMPPTLGIPYVPPMI